MACCIVPGLVVRGKRWGWPLRCASHPQIISVTGIIATEDVVDGQVPSGGIAWDGDQSIWGVELQVNDGDWMAMTPRTPPLSELTWVQWRYDLPWSPGNHAFRVRARYHRRPAD